MSLGAWRAADVRAAEAALMAHVPAGTLMQRAASGLARRAAGLLSQRYGGVYGRRVLVLVGAGDNGGDALYAGGRLAARGALVTAVLLRADRVHPAGLVALRDVGGHVVSAVPSRADLVLDGIVGLGGKGGLHDAAAGAVAAAATALAEDGGTPIIVAVDLPSGIEVDSGAVLGPAVNADVTVTFGCLKPGLVVGAGARRAGAVEVVDIGLTSYLTAPPALRQADQEDVATWWPRVDATADKYSRGVVGLATGGAAYPGAAVLSTGGACAGPAGLVRYAGGGADAVIARYPSVIVTAGVADAGRVQAWVCGSGIGTDLTAATTLRTVLASPVPVCLDADALTLLVDGSMADWLRDRHAPTVVTPHDREFARLDGAPPGPDRVEAALGLAAKLRAVVLLKGDRTVIASPGGEVWTNPTATADLATGGSGDVLAGLLGSLLAAGLPAVRAATAAAYLHGLAGRRAARGGPVTAVDVVAALRAVVGEVAPGSAQS